MVRLAPGSSRALSTSIPRQWNYTLTQTLIFSGPSCRKTTERTQVSTNKESETMRMPMPVGLRLQDPPRSNIQEMRSLANAVNLSNRIFGDIMDTHDQSTMKREADVIEDAVPYFLNPARTLAPHILRRMGFTGDLKWARQPSQSNSVPDVICTYNGHAILALDYKGPNCIFEEELLACCATSVQDALRRLQAPAEKAPSSSKGKSKATISQSRMSKNPSLVSGVNQFTEALLKQGIKYSKKWKISTVLFYDYDYLLAIRPPEGLSHVDNKMLMDIVICPEREKSTETKRVTQADNHVSVLLQYIIEAVREYEAKSAISSSRSKQNKR